MPSKPPVHRPPGSASQQQRRKQYDHLRETTASSTGATGNDTLIQREEMRGFRMAATAMGGLSTRCTHGVRHSSIGVVQEHQSEIRSYAPRLENYA